MVRGFRGRAGAITAVSGVLLVCGVVRSVGAVCLGDCNGNGTVSAGELTKIIAIILNCDAVAAGCAAVPGGCTAADKNGDGKISAGELTNIISDILNFPDGCPVVTLPTATVQASNTPAGPTATRTSPPQINTPTPSGTPTVSGPPLGDRTFSLGPGSGFFSSLLTGKVGIPVGTLMLSAGPMDATGKANVTLTNSGTVIRTDLPAGMLTLCTRLESCSGVIYCNGGANVDVLNSLDSLKAGLTCAHSKAPCIPPTPPKPPTPSPGPLPCCSNACEGVCTSPAGPTRTPGGPTPTPCVNSGNTSIQLSPPPSVTPTDSGPGSVLLICMQRSAQVMPVGPCDKADFSTASVTTQYYTTGVNTTQVLNHCPGSGAAANRVPKLARKGANFDCAHWTMENGAGIIGFTIPSEEGSTAITGDGANAGLWSDQ